jgi:hypothetical protein
MGNSAEMQSNETLICECPICSPPSTTATNCAYNETYYTTQISNL